MLPARQLLFMRRARDRAIGGAVAPIGAVALLPDPNVRRRVCSVLGHAGLSWTLLHRSIGLVGRSVAGDCPHAGGRDKGAGSEPQPGWSEAKPRSSCPRRRTRIALRAIRATLVEPMPRYSPAPRRLDGGDVDL